MLPVPTVRPAERGAGWVAAHRAPARAPTPAAAGSADVDGELVGVALSFTRELDLVPRDVRRARRRCRVAASARQLLAAALHARPRLPARDAQRLERPGAVRRYRQAGFDAAPADDPARHRRPHRDPRSWSRVREGSARRPRPDGLRRPAGPRRRARAGPRDPAAPAARLLVSDDRDRLAATPTSTPEGAPRPARGDLPSDRRRAAVGRRSPTSAPGAEVAVHHVTAANEWALDVGLAAGLDRPPAGLPRRCAACARRRRTSTTARCSERRRRGPCGRPVRARMGAP